MSGDPQIQPAPRARAVAEAPLDALLADADDLARRWAIALIHARPLERIGEIPLEDFAREAPALCALAVRSLSSDVELERMAGMGSAAGREDSTPARKLGALAGARGGPAAVEAVEALRGVLWEALLAELRWPIFDRSPGRLVADLADRLAYVCARVLAASLTHAQAAPADEPEVVSAHRREAVPGADRSPLAPRVVLVDERGDMPARPAASRRVRGAEGSAHVHTLEHTLQRTESWRAAPGGARSIDSSDAPRAPDAPRSPGTQRPPGTPRTGARPRPWDTPLRAERSDDASADALGRGSMGEGGDAAGSRPEMRVRRGPTAPADEPA